MTDKYVMSRHEFSQEIVGRRIQLIQEVLQNKQAEYSMGDDAFHNFRNGTGLSFTKMPEKVAWGFMVKHLRSIMDMLDQLDCGDCYMGYPSMDLIEEKFGDAINYFILIEGMLKERAMEYQRLQNSELLKSMHGNE